MLICNITWKVGCNKIYHIVFRSYAQKSMQGEISASDYISFRLDEVLKKSEVDSFDSGKNTDLVYVFLI